MNKKRKHFLLYAVTASICAAMLFSSCSSDEKNKDNENDNVSAQSTIIVKSAEPSNGIGREKIKHEEKALESNGYVICIDPGHGFVDGGCGDQIWADGTLEKDITLAVAKKLSKELKNLGFATIMTHDGEKFPKSNIDDGNQIFNPNERVAYVNTLDIDYFVSIHVNSSEYSDASGVRIYYENDSNWRKTGKNSELIAEKISLSILEEMKPETAPSTYDQTSATYAVVRDTMVAASLIEIGFSTNETDAENMVNDEWQNSLAKAIADGLYTYFTGKSTDG